jgi:hypothetical protein
MGPSTPLRMSAHPSDSGSQFSATPPVPSTEKSINNLGGLRSDYQFSPSYNPFITKSTADFNEKYGSPAQNDMASKRSQQQSYNWEPNVSYNGKQIHQDQSDPQRANNPGSLSRKDFKSLAVARGYWIYQQRRLARCNGNEGPVSDGIFKFEEYLNAEDESLTEMSAGSSSTLLPLLQPLQPLRHSAGASRGRDGSASRTIPRMLSPPPSPPVALRTFVQEPSCQTNDNLGPVDGVARRQGFLMPSASGTLTLMSERTYSDGKTFSKDFDRFFWSPRNATTASEHSLATILRDIPDEVKWSGEELRFFAQHRKGRGMGLEHYHGLPASHNLPDNSDIPESSRTLKRMPSERYESAMRPAKMSRVEAADGIVEEQRLNKSYYSPSSSGHPYSMDVAALNMPYEPNVHTVEYGSYRLHRRAEDVKLVFGQDQNLQFLNYSPGESRPVCGKQPRIMLQDHLKRRRDMASENSERPPRTPFGTLFPSPISGRRFTSS